MSIFDNSRDTNAIRIEVAFAPAMRSWEAAWTDSVVWEHIGRIYEEPVTIGCRTDDQLDGQFAIATMGVDDEAPIRQAVEDALAEIAARRESAVG